MLSWLMSAALVAERPAPTRESWGLSRDGESVKLGYGIPETDAVVLMLQWVPGSNRVTLVWSANRSEPFAQIASARAAERVRVSNEVNEVSGGWLLEASLSVRSAVMTSFAKSGKIGVSLKPGQISVPAAPTELATKFVGRCR
jgi:hypothetical protein